VVLVDPGVTADAFMNAIPPEAIMLSAPRAATSVIDSHRE
jgi:hypothetical protein